MKNIHLLIQESSAKFQKAETQKQQEKSDSYGTRNPQ